MKKTGKLPLLLVFALSIALTACKSNVQEISGNSAEESGVSDGRDAAIPEGEEQTGESGTTESDGVEHEAMTGPAGSILPDDPTQPGSLTQPGGPTQPDASASSHASAAMGQEPSIEEADWSSYFQGLNGGAVIYLPNENKYQIYNENVCNTRRSPCSTFKIISSLIGIKNGVISEENSVRKWSGETFWNDKWNRDIGFKDAFQTSCVWYFRKITNELGPEMIQEELDKLNYGNRDISDWEGRLNNNNSNRSLTGFWIESSLKISPKEQVEVLERIFSEDSSYKEQELALLKDAMLVTDTGIPNIKIYGKTGLGKTSGIVADAWFTGFADTGKEKIYFCVYLGETDNKDFSSADAKRIAIELIRDHYLPPTE